jgi:dihydroflavonol-4-reductase
MNVAGIRLLEKLAGWRNAEPPIDAPSVEMGEHFWWCDSRKAQAELGFAPRDPQETLLETVRYVDAHFRGKGRPRTSVSSLSPGASRGRGMG